MIKRASICLLGALICLMFIIAGTGVVHAASLVTNYAGVDWTDNLGNSYITVWDTASVMVFLGPDLRITKDVKNVNSDETSPYMVTAVRGDTIEFILTVSNYGNTDARNVAVIDSVPLGTEYILGSTTDTNGLDPTDPPDTITFQHVAGGPFDTNEAAPVAAIKWEWDKIGDLQMHGARTIKFRVKILE